ncbi:MAG TPA: GNAT family N-acetyltransferase [Slackia equolifaciens]|uniref:GNAT family N-acetyltransferase n=1 Tax=Slackia equolifaciens TaxID=498718 RepID=A0A9D2UWQ1_9ACTN|nr:GNAT family N-acetyltransferase [Slackia equolifaciens]
MCDMEDIAIRPFEAGDISAMRAIWNEVVADGRAFPQEDPLGNDEEAKEFFESQTAAVVAVGGQVERSGREGVESFPTGEGCVGRADGEAPLADGAQKASEAGEVLGLYILHPNNVGRCGHIANTSYAVSKAARGKHVGAALVTDSLHRAKACGFRVLQFNAVVASNASALHLYEKLGFTRLGAIPGGFRNIEGVYEDIYPHYFDLTTLD